MNSLASEHYTSYGPGDVLHRQDWLNGVSSMAGYAVSQRGNREERLLPDSQVLSGAAGVEKNYKVKKPAPLQTNRNKEPFKTLVSGRSGRDCRVGSGQSTREGRAPRSKAAKHNNPPYL